MCGIFGIISSKPAAPIVLEALKRLGYRGYDSAGVATLDDGHLARRRAEGKITNLEAVLKQKPLRGSTGIGHTRWATHGKPTEANAHPHATARVSLVHNGIIENYKELKDRLMTQGSVFQSDTDTEVVAQLVDHYLARGFKPLKAVRSALKELTGAFALAIIFDGYEDLIIIARRGSPLAVGYGDDEMSLGSDAAALATVTDKISYLEDGDHAVLTRSGVTFFDANGRKVKREVLRGVANKLLVDKGGRKHFMLKEIYEQPEVVGHTLEHCLNFATGELAFPEDFTIDFAHVQRILLTACGTAYHAASISKYWLEKFARIPVDIDIASELRYREPPLTDGTLMIVVSQSGETADTLASLHYAKKAGIKVLAVVNVAESSIARDATEVLQTLAGPEIGVASTKAFTCQLAALAALTLKARNDKGYMDDDDDRRKLIEELSTVPALMYQATMLEEQVIALAHKIASAEHVLYMGRGTSSYLALEGALKLTEISYIHAQGFAAGELKHGPIALIDEKMPIIALAPFDQWFDKTAANISEVVARGGQVTVFTDKLGQEKLAQDGVNMIILPETTALTMPMVYAVPLQQLSYHTAEYIGTDVDQPRNLAKSVTVE